MNPKSKTRLILLNLVFLFAILSMTGRNKKDLIVNNENFFEQNTIITVRLSGYWDNFSFIHITGSNWSVAAGYDWVSGSGTYSDPYIIENISIDAAGSRSGITISESNVYFEINNCTLTNSSTFYAGIQLINVTNGAILNNNLSSNYNGISLAVNSLNNTISGNFIERNTNNGISLGTSPNNNISKNYILSNGYDGINLDDSDNNTIIENIIENHTNHFNDFGIYFFVSMFNLVSYNNITNNSGGAYDNMGNSNSIIKNNITFSDYNGISTDLSWGLTIKQNNISYSEFRGISLSNCWSSRVFRNVIFNNSLHGIHLWSSVLNGNFSENIIFNNTENGIDIDGGSNNNNFISNNVSYNLNNGFRLDNSVNNNFTGNNMFNNGNFGIEILSAGNDSLIIYNNITGNNINAQDNGINNQWNNTAHGNYWSDYLGSDNDKNGIGDTPYDVPPGGGSIDNYPIIFLDTKAPNVTINLPIFNQLNGTTPPSFNVEYMDDYYFNTSWYILDNGTYFTTKKIFTTNTSINQTIWNQIGNGTLRITFYGNDTRGNIGSASVNVTKDVIGPIINVLVPQPNTLFGQFVVFVINVTEFPSRFDDLVYSFDGGLENHSYSSTSGSGNTLTYWCFGDQAAWDAWDAFGNGTVPVWIFANDTLGNLNIVTFNLRKDIIVPNITITPDNGTGVIDSPNYVLNIVEPNLHTIWYSIFNGTQWSQNYTGGLSGMIDPSLWNSMPDAQLIIRFYANDSVGNIGWQDVIITKNTPTGDGPPNGDDNGNIIIIIIIIIIIGSVIGLSVPAIYIRKNKEKNVSHKKKYLSNEIEFDDKPREKMVNYLIKSEGEKKILDLLSEKMPLSKIKELKLTALSDEFINKINELNLTIEEKREFIEEMLTLPPKERDEIIDSMLEADSDKFLG
jgi:parallel beta-helix repeat protein